MEASNIVLISSGSCERPSGFRQATSIMDQKVTVYIQPGAMNGNDGGRSRLSTLWRSEDCEIFRWSNTAFLLRVNIKKQTNQQKVGQTYRWICKLHVSWTDVEQLIYCVSYSTVLCTDLFQSHWCCCHSNSILDLLVFNILQTLNKMFNSTFLIDFIVVYRGCHKCWPRSRGVTPPAESLHPPSQLCTGLFLEAAGIPSPVSSDTDRFIIVARRTVTCVH